MGESIFLKMQSQLMNADFSLMFQVVGCRHGLLSCSVGAEIAMHPCCDRSSAACCQSISMGLHDVRAGVFSVSMS